MKKGLIVGMLLFIVTACGSNFQPTENTSVANNSSSALDAGL